MGYDVSKEQIRLTEIIENEVEKMFSYENFKELLPTSKHLVDAGGKRLRPLLLLFSYKGTGGKNDRLAGKIGALIECIHTFSLIHDDLIDESDTRRGVPAVHRKFGFSAALLAGDYLTQIIYKMISETQELELDLRLRIVNELANCCTEMIRGELMDATFEGSNNVSEADYFDLISLKSGSLLEYGSRIGAILAKAPEPIVGKLGRFGNLIGCAFQIRDDVLDLTGDPSSLGKPLWKDIKEGKRTLVVIHALRRCKKKDREKLANILGNVNITNAELEAGIDLLRKSGSIQYANKYAITLVTKAKSILKDLRSSVYREALDNLADLVVSRSH